jgi:hypothetical protein
MSKNLFISLALAVVLLSGCSNQTETSLNQKLKQYKKCYTEKDYICMSTMVLPSVIEETGGVEGFIQLMDSLPTILAQQGFTMDAAEMEFGKSGKIVAHEEFAVSVIPTKQPVVVQGTNGIVEGSVIAFSADKGDTWFFLEGSDEGKIAIANDAPALLQKIDIPVPKLKLGDVVLIQKNGQWIKQ